ncbi:MAG: hypothetical protein HN457_17735 [Opitutales bacterium]|jgi:hypothetical protein|nr:hypothetical protein [Opitutales bacterium]MBT5814057.1 hypothetical protein [Opitutales bacterium]MBT6379231.1 hypothetical protein [Opitutales bacterium]MBT6768178.1 hypothetical protein [Opitutales bacterium]
MFGGHDINNGGALDSAELANSIESRYGMRQEATIDFRDNLVSEGGISAAERSKGIITLRLMPEDAAAITMKGGDTNNDQLLEAAEFLDTVSSLRKLDLGTRAPLAGRS